MAEHADAAGELSEAEEGESSSTSVRPTGEDSSESPEANSELAQADTGWTRGVGGADFEDYDTAVETAADDASFAKVKTPQSRVKWAVTAGLVAVVAVSALVGWLGFRAYEAHQADKQTKLFLQVGRQGALNLTTIDWEHAEADVQRIQDSATGSFSDDFAKRSPPFVAVVKKAESKTVGTVTEAGIESVSDSAAVVLVAVSVKSSNVGATEQDPRTWRMRITVQNTNDGAKVSNVAFVP